MDQNKRSQPLIVNLPPCKIMESSMQIEASRRSISTLKKSNVQPPRRKIYKSLYGDPNDIRTQHWDTYQSTYSKHFNNIKRSSVDYSQLSQLNTTTQKYSQEDITQVNTQSEDHIQILQTLSSEIPNNTVYLPKLGGNTDSDIMSLLNCLPADNTFWKEIIPQELMDDKNFSLPDFLSENQQYVNNLLGLYFKERAAKDIPLGKITMHQRKSSSYHTDYNFKTPIIQQTSSQMPQTFQSSQKVDSLTSYKEQFTPKISDGTQLRFQPSEEHLQNHSQMSLLTTYNQDYYDWKPSQVERFRSHSHLTQGVFPFTGQTMYKSDFKTQNRSTPFTFTKKKQYNFARLKWSFSPNRKYGVQNEPGSRRLQRIEIIPNSTGLNNRCNLIQQFKKSIKPVTQSYEGQFKSTTNSDYKQQSLSTTLQQQKIWKQQVLRKLMETTTASNVKQGYKQQIYQ